MSVSVPFVVRNHQVLSLAEATVPANDRSFLFGDSLYEVIATYHGQPFFTTDHLQRLRRSAQGLYFNLPWDDTFFVENIRLGLSHLPIPEVYIRLVVTRGPGDFNIDIDTAQGQPECLFFFKPLPSYAPAAYETGIRMAVPTMRRNSPLTLSPALKTGNYMNNMLCLAEAKQQGAEDALILALDGNITEATTSNFFMVKNGELWTPPLEVGILAGITRHYLIRLAREQGIVVHEANFGLAELASADEAFLSSTIKGAMHVCEVGPHFKRPDCGPITRQLNEMYWQYVAHHLDPL